MKINLTLFIGIIIHISAFSQWIHTGGPNGGYTNEIVQVGPVLILSAGNGGIYKSLDDGKSWNLSISGLPCNASVQALVEHNGLVYASISKSGIYISDDKGDSWIAINSGIENLTFYNFIVDGNNIYAGNANGGIYYSPDNGVSWSNKSNGISSIQFQDFLIFNSKVYASGVSLYETSNNGDTWTKIDIPNLNLNGIRAMTVKNNIFYASSEGTVFVSSDNLVSWNEYTINNNGASIVNMLSANNFVYLTTSLGRYYYTNDNGVNWTLVENTNTNSFVNDLFFINNTIIMSTTEGLYESSDVGTSWSENNNGINALQIESLNKNNSFLFAGTENQGIFRSADNSQKWTNISNGLNAANALHIYEISVIGNYIFIATGGGIYSSPNNGDTWELKLDPGVNKSTQVLDYDNGIFVTGINGTGIYISSDNGETWNLTQTNGLNIDTSYECILINGNTIIVSTQDGEMFISNNLGNTWNNISITNSYHYTYDLELDNNKLYAATSKGLMVSTNLGQNWTPFNNDSKITHDVLFDSDKIYIATSSGVYVATDLEKKWYSLCDGMGLQSTNKLLLNNSALFAGTFGLSVWKRFKVDGDLPPTESSSTIGINKLSLCPNSSPVNLFSKIGISSDTKGTWIPNLASASGIFDPSVDSLGLYTFKYENDLCGCENYLKIEVTFDSQVNAGGDATITICKENTPINLYESLEGNPDLGGTWSPQPASGTNIFDPSIDSAGIYTYNVSSADCGMDTAEVTIVLVNKPNTGINGSLSICSNKPEVDLLKSLGGTPDIGGIWSPILSSGTNIFNPSIDKSGIFTYTINNGNCLSVSEVNVTVFREPNTGIDGDLSICANSSLVNLFDSLKGNPDTGGTWSPILLSGSGIFNPSEDLAGTYTYTINSICGNYSSQVSVSTFDRYDTPNYNINIVDFSNLNSIIITVNDNLHYEYSLDGTLFQNNNIFNNLLGGNYMVFGREINGCGFFQKSVFVLDYPKFFTPNGDGYNDVWQLMGISNEKYSLYIFDRFGKLLKKLDTVNYYWDGIYDGNPMPSTDYWFKIIFEDGSNKVGHFTLKR